MEYHVVSPAYGRDYKNASDAERDFREGKDFVCHDIDADGKYCSVRDFPSGDVVNIRYNGMRSIYVFTVE